MSHICRKCKEPKTAAQMKPWGGKPSKICLGCAEKPAGGGSAVKTKAKGAKTTAQISAEVPAPTGTVDPNRIEIEHGYGVRAWIDESYLMLQQDDGEGKTDALCLSRAEFRVLVEKYKEWARC